MQTGGFLAPEKPVGVARAWAVVVPVPLARGAAAARGAHTAPAEIIAASCQVETHDLDVGRDPTDRGLATAPPVDPVSDDDGALEAIGRTVEGHLRAGRFPLLLGGEATVLAGSARGLGRALPGAGVLRLEGTLGGEAAWLGRRAAPRTATRRAAELLPLRACGWRLASPAARSFAERRGVAGPPARLLATGVPGIDPGRGAADALRGLPAEIWVAVDVSVLDPSALPMPGNLEPAGLAYTDLAALLAAAFAARRVAGAEITGLVPHPGDVLPALVAARLGLRILALAHRQRFPSSREPRALSPPP